MHGDLHQTFYLTETLQLKDMTNLNPAYQDIIIIILLIKNDLNVAIG